MDEFRRLINLVDYQDSVDYLVRKITENTEDYLQEYIKSSGKELVRGLNRGPSVPEKPDRGLNPHGDMRDQVNTVMGFGRPKRQSLPRSDSIDHDFSKNGKYGEGLKNNVEEFYQDAEKEGYSPYMLPMKNNGVVPAVRTTNGIQIKMALGSTGKQQVMYFDCPNRDVQKAIKNEIVEAGFTLGNSENKEVSVRCSTTNFSQSLKEFWRLVDIIESMGSDFHSSGRARSTKSKITTPQTPFKYYLGAASLIFVANRFGLPHLLPRGGKEDGSGTFDIKDSLITVGYTPGAKMLMQNGQKPYREHAVPCKVIIDSAIDMYQDKGAFTGNTIDFTKIADVAKMIQRNLIIILTDKETETSRMDRVYQSSMPSGWNPIDGDVLARFDDIDPPIPVYPISGISRLA